jgi:cysteine desulfurase
MGEACRIMREKGKEEAKRLRDLRDSLYGYLIRELGAEKVERNGAELTRTLPQTLNVWLKGVDTDLLTAGLSDVAVSTGSACSAHSNQPSHVLRSLYPGSPERWQQSLRMAVGRATTEEMVRKAAERIAEEIRKL